VRFIERNGYSQLFLSVLDTREWAKQIGGSYLKGKRLFAQWDEEGNLIELKIDGEDNLPEDHPSQR
jgi:hypothetical protein